MPNDALKAKLPDIFTYHAPTVTQPSQYAAIREAALVFATVLIDNTPPCADQSAALRELRNCVMIANASVALNGLV